MSAVAKNLIVLGIIFIILGMLLGVGGHLFSWFGKLPGDIRIQKGNFSLYAPLTSMILVSIILNLIIYIISKILMK
jgi:uncharacterized protein HemY